MLEHALSYAARGWRVMPLHTIDNGRCTCGRDCGKDAAKHPRIKAWQKAATTGEAQIRAWWTRWPNANIGLATGSGLVVLDIDGPENLAVLAELTALYGPLPRTLTARTGRGAHAYFTGDIGSSKTVERLLVRGEGGYVVAPPSTHASGVFYQWIEQIEPSAFPDWFKQWLETSGGTRESALNLLSQLGEIPAHLRKNIQPVQRSDPKLSTPAAAKVLEALRTPWTAHDEARIMSALAAVPASCPRDPWLHIGMALHSLGWQRPDGTDAGFELWDRWSATCSDKYSLQDVETRWRSFNNGRHGITIGTLFHLAEQHGWGGMAPREAPDGHDNAQPLPAHLLAGAPLNGHHVAVNGHVLPAALTAASLTAESPLIRLNEKYAVIGDIGGKCLVLGYVPSKVDDAIRVPSFQSFKSFQERYANQYVMVPKQTRDGWSEEAVQVGTHWLKWRQRRGFDGIDLVPGGPHILPGNALNLWTGFAVEPAPGRWDRMKDHIVRILAREDAASLDYIMRWAAWFVQNPGERAEVALVFKGEKGSGKGSFANALKRIAGQHGLQIFNSKHLVGSFNGHLRNCLLLFADEAFWAGDKQGESVLKGMLTEPALMIEQKGVDAAPWKNRLHVIMAANAEWVVPASHDERRYAVFDVDSRHVRNEEYFDALHAELRNGGMAAMLHDLLRVDLKDWHPRRVVQTEALREQKARSMDPRHEWFESLLQDGILPYTSKETPDTVAAGVLMTAARDYAPRLKDMNPTAFGRFLKDMGCIKIHMAGGNAWRFPPVPELRARWERRYTGWKWEQEVGEWKRRL